MKPGKTIIVPPPAITCPAAPAPVTLVSGQTVVVTYGSAAVTGGFSPVSTACAPPSGSAFALGSTTVTCTAVDAFRRTAACTFAVTVKPPRLNAMTILAFGDSITEGEVPLASEFAVAPRHVVQGSAYPAVLATLLAQRYAGQPVSRVDAFTLHSDNTTDCTPNPPLPAGAAIVVINAGCLGEAASALGTLLRLNSKLAAYHPDVVLLLEGVNDLDASHFDASIAAGVLGVQTLIRAAQLSGAFVMVGTLLPEIAGLPRSGPHALIVPFNAQLKPAATAAGAQVVDLYTDIATNISAWISPYDGLHPTEAGYQEIANVWFANIRAALESALAARGLTH